MQHEFWHNKWRNSQIGFHEDLGNTLLKQHFSSLQLHQQHCVFVPLCGKSADMTWLVQQNVEVIGVELNESAVEQYFESLDQLPVISLVGNLKCYQGKNITIWVGDIFELTQSQLGRVDAIYDRAALVALPEDMREQYRQHLLSICNHAPQLLITLEYDQSLTSGPPFSINNSMVNEYYQSNYQVELLAEQFLRQDLKGKIDVTERLFKLTPN